LSFGIAVLSVAVAFVAARLLDIYLAAATSSLFLCAIMFSTWAGGTRAGLFSVALSLLCFKYYFVVPVHSLAIQPDEIPRTILYSPVGSLRLVIERQAEEHENSRYCAVAARNASLMAFAMPEHFAARWDHLASHKCG